LKKEKMDWARLKEEGNNLLKDGDIHGAIAKYTDALDKCKDDKENLQILYSNRSAAYLKDHDMENALKDAVTCIDLNPSWAKAYSRKSAVLREMKMYKEASEVAQEGLKLEPTNVALKTLHRACETSLVCNKLRGTWHGKVAEEVGGYMQSFDFWSDSDVRVTVLGTTVDAKYELDVFGTPYPHLDMSVPNSPGSAFVRHIYRFENEDELHLCSPYLRPPEERPTEFKGAGMVIMKRGAFELSEEEKKEREAIAALPLNDRVIQFLERCIEAVPKFDVRPKEGESEVVIGEKLTANVKFQTFYQGLVEKIGPDAEQQVKELVVGIKSLQSEPQQISDLVQMFQQRMRQAGLISDGDETSAPAPVGDATHNHVVGSAPEEVLANKETISRFVSGADEPLAEIDASMFPPPSAESDEAPKPKPKKATPVSATSSNNNSSDLSPVVIGVAVVAAVAAIAAAAWFGSRDRD